MSKSVSAEYCVGSSRACATTSLSWGTCAMLIGHHACSLRVGRPGSVRTYIALLILLTSSTLHSCTPAYVHDYNIILESSTQPQVGRYLIQQANSVPRSPSFSYFIINKLSSVATTELTCESFDYLLVSLTALCLDDSITAHCTFRETISDFLPSFADMLIAHCAFAKTLDHGYCCKHEYLSKILDSITDTGEFRPRVYSLVLALQEAALSVMTSLAHINDPSPMNDPSPDRYFYKYIDLLHVLYADPRNAFGYFTLHTPRNGTALAAKVLCDLHAVRTWASLFNQYISVIEAGAIAVDTAELLRLVAEDFDATARTNSGVACIGADHYTSIKRAIAQASACLSEARCPTITDSSDIVISVFWDTVFLAIANNDTTALSVLSKHLSNDTNVGNFSSFLLRDVIPQVCNYTIATAYDVIVDSIADPACNLESDLTTVNEALESVILIHEQMNIPIQAESMAPLEAHLLRYGKKCLGKAKGVESGIFEYISATSRLGFNAVYDAVLEHLLTTVASQANVIVNRWDRETYFALLRKLVEAGYLEKKSIQIAINSIYARIITAKLAKYKDRPFLERLEKMEALELLYTDIAAMYGWEQGIVEKFAQARESIVKELLGSIKIKTKYIKGETVTYGGYYEHNCNAREKVVRYESEVSGGRVVTKPIIWYEYDTCVSKSDNSKTIDHVQVTLESKRQIQICATVWVNGYIVWADRPSNDCFSTYKNRRMSVKKYVDVHHGRTVAAVKAKQRQAARSEITVRIMSVEIGGKWRRIQEMKTPLFLRQRKIEIGSGELYMDKHEVTVGEFWDCVLEGKCYWPKETDTKCNLFNGDKLHYPADCVHMQNAEQYCEWKRGRLPSEAEWESAAKGSDGNMYPWGSEKPKCRLAVTDDCDLEYSLPVCSRPEGNTRSGLCDMVGNVSELTKSTKWYKDFGRYYEYIPKRHVAKGCSFVCKEKDLLLSSSSWHRKFATSRTVGFRCVYDAAE